MADDKQYPVTWTHRRTGATRLVYNKSGEVKARFEGFAEGGLTEAPEVAPTEADTRTETDTFMPGDQVDESGGPDPDPTH
jgi:hypothetical protein